jgi:hypothetical protein
LRCADESLEEGDVRAIAPFLKVVRELNLYHGVNVGSARPAPAALPEKRRDRRRLRLRTRPARRRRICSKTKKSARKRT